jgi:hypothetical protein
MMGDENNYRERMKKNGGVMINYGFVIMERVRKKKGRGQHGLWTCGSGKYGGWADWKRKEKKEKKEEEKEEEGEEEKKRNRRRGERRRRSEKNLVLGVHGLCSFCG